MKLTHSRSTWVIFVGGSMWTKLKIVVDIKQIYIIKIQSVQVTGESGDFLIEKRVRL